MAVRTATPEFISMFNELLGDQANLAELRTRLNAQGGIGVPVPGSGVNRPFKTIEDKNFRRNEVYAGVIGTWQEWSFNFLTTVEGINPQVGAVLTETAKKSANPLTVTALQALVPAELREKHGAELFQVLCGLTTGEANGVVRGVASKLGMGRCGFAAYYALSFRFNPKTPARALQFMFTVINPPVIKDVRLIPKGIEDWEARRAVMRDEFDEILSDRMAAAILTQMLPADFQDTVLQGQGAGEVAYEVIKDKVLAIAGTKIQKAAPTPMDVGEVNRDAGLTTTTTTGDDGEEINQLGKGGGLKCYNCGGKGHLSKDCATPKGKGLTKGDGKGYPKGGKGEDRECYNCGKKGHLAKDCWAPKGGYPKGG